MKLSVVIIAKDAEGSIADAISSVDFADEVIVVDNNSSDRTVEIAKYLKAKIVNNNSSDFSKLRNLGLQKALGDWILYIDTDEQVSKELRESIELAVQNRQLKAIAYKINRKNFYLGNNEWPYIEKLERLFYKEKIKGWRGELHESPMVDGDTGELDGFLFHFTHRDLASMLSKTIVWSETEAQLRFKAGHPKMVWWRFIRVMITAFLDSFVKQSGWKAGTVGLIESTYQSFSMFITYARLWEMQQDKTK